MSAYNTTVLCTNTTQTATTFRKLLVGDNVFRTEFVFCNQSSVRKALNNFVSCRHITLKKDVNKSYLFWTFKIIIKI